MESCKSETAAKGGWTQQEDRLLRRSPHGRTAGR